ncbi:MAG: prephenate dehydrogenase [Lachnospiraceae bacterium]|nr:prephenate dehydrogenase [Lachnospiraceae bacterium]
MSELTCGFIGLGLIGGSIARALKEARPHIRIIAYDINEEALALALKEGVADSITSAIDNSFSSCDYLFLCAPVSCNDDNLLAIKEVLSPDCILTDVGSVKTNIHQHIKEAGLSAQFIGGHPMAGSERFGYANSKAMLLQNAYYILTPSPETNPHKLASYENLVSEMGAIPLVLSYEEHDFITAAVSHLPHVIASTLVNLVRISDSPEGTMKQIAAGGFKDITRIASSSPTMWQQICLSNGENIAGLLQRYIDALTRARTAIENKDEAALYELFDTARIYRDSFINSSSGPIKRAYDLTVDIADKPGSMATIVSLLAEHGISIKNIGITHNREAAEGSMHLEFYEEDAMQMTKKLLQEKHYDIK